MQKNDRGHCQKFRLMKTKIFCDIADYETIKFFNNKPIVDGFTTNPSLMRIAGAKNYRDELGTFL